MNVELIDLPENRSYVSLDRSSISAGRRQFSQEKFQQYVEVDQEYGLSLTDFAIFGDRSPGDYQKVRLLTKI